MLSYEAGSVNLRPQRPEFSRLGGRISGTLYGNGVEIVFLGPINVKMKSFSHLSGTLRLPVVLATVPSSFSGLLGRRTFA
jgi:hypothetical protein